jgi:small subunit ribosomal protein S1
MSIELINEPEKNSAVDKNGNISDESVKENLTDDSNGNETNANESVEKSVSESTGENKTNETKTENQPDEGNEIQNSVDGKSEDISEKTSPDETNENIDTESQKVEPETEKNISDSPAEGSAETEISQESKDIDTQETEKKDNDDAKSDTEQKTESEEKEEPKEDTRTERQKYFDEMFADLRKKIETRDTIEVEIKARIRGGLRVQYKDIPMFLPTSHYTLKRNPSEEEMQNALNQKIMVNVHELQEFDEGRKAVIVSRKKLLLEEVWEKIKVGDIIEGKVTSVASFGVFVEFEGIEGLIHISRLSKIHIDDPNRFFRKGQDIQAKIIDINKRKSKIALSRKELEASPWKGIEEEIKPGSQVKGIVRRLTHFGAYIELKPGVDGLLRNSELSWTKRVKKPSDVLSPGQEILVEVISINEEKENATLSFKRTQPNPWPELAEKYSVGSEHEAEVLQVIPQGAIISITEELDGFMPRSRMKPVMKARKIPYKSGDKLTVVISDLNPDEESLILSPKTEDDIMSKPESSKSSSGKGKSSSKSSFSFGDMLSESEREKLKSMNNKE